jgi:hypothetical protein
LPIEQAADLAVKGLIIAGKFVIVLGHNHA